LLLWFSLPCPMCDIRRIQDTIDMTKEPT